MQSTGSANQTVNKVNNSIVCTAGLSWQAVDSPDKFGLSPLMIAGL